MPLSPARLLLATALALTAAGCQADTTTADDPGYTVVRVAEPRQGLLQATQDVVLHVTGAPAGDVQLDLDGLEDLGLVEYAVDDQQAEGRVATFRGVLLRDLLEALDVSSDATLHTVALNDYAVDIPAQDAWDSPVLLATSVDGERIPVDRFGPIRVVYPYETHDLDPRIHDPRWIWQLASIDIR